MSRMAAVSTALLIAITLALVVGCRPETKVIDPVAHRLTVTLERFGFEGGLKHWVIVGSPDGRTPWAVRSVPANHVTIDFGDPAWSTITLTVVEGLDSGVCTLQSFVGAPSGDWVITGNLPPDYIGSASLLINYPTDQYSEFHVSFPARAEDCQSGYVYESHATVEQGILALESGALSCLARIHGTHGDLAGWLLNQPFRLHETNNYEMTLDQPVPIRTLTASRSMEFIDLNALRGQPEVSYLLDSGMPNATSAALKVPAFPANGYRISCRGDRWEYSVRVDSVPSSLTIPPGTVVANYDAIHMSWINIRFPGLPDVLWAEWYASDSHPYYWDVWREPNGAPFSLPVIPDSILHALSMNRNNFQPALIGTDDYGSVASYVQYIEKAYLQYPSTLASDRYHFRTVAPLSPGPDTPSE
jgi:hypothetical protein